MAFTPRVEVADVSQQDYAVLTVLGPGGGDLAAGLEGVRARVEPGPFGSIDLIVARDLLPNAAAELVRRAGAGALGGMWAFEALRIAARVPRAPGWALITAPSRTRSAGSTPRCT